MIGGGEYGKIFRMGSSAERPNTVLDHWRDNRCVTVLIYFVHFMETTAQVIMLDKTVYFTVCPETKCQKIAPVCFACKLKFQQSKL